jgi:hypothetical protein
MNMLMYFEDFFFFFFFLDVSRDINIKPIFIFLEMYCILSFSLIFLF